MDVTRNQLDFIYVLMEDDLPFYIGKTHYPKRREREHRVKYGDISLFILEACNNKNWKEIEQKWIQYYQSLGLKLTNKNPGGGGPEKGIKRNKEFGDKISKSKKGVKRPFSHILPSLKSKQKEVIQFSKDGEELKTFPSAKDAAHYIGIHHNTMYDHLNGKYKTSRGYIFKYKN